MPIALCRHHINRALCAAAVAIVLFGTFGAFAEDIPRVTVATKHFGGVQLMSIGIDGSNPVQLTNEPDGATQPTWCPDGSKIAYVVGPVEQGKIKVMDADGKNAHLLLTEGGSQRTPQWSPDGKQIAFSMLADGSNYDIFVVSADGKDLKDLTPTPIFEADPNWSPDGKKIVFAAVPTGGYPAVWTMNPDGTGQFDVLGKTLNVAVYPTWSADGKKITFGAPDDNEQIQITEVNADGTDWHVLTSGPQPHSYAAWSPDGNYLAYVSDPGSENADLCIYDPATKEHRVVLKGDVFEELFRDARPAWVPVRAKEK